MKKTKEMVSLNINLVNDIYSKITSKEYKEFIKTDSTKAQNIAEQAWDMLPADKWNTNFSGIVLSELLYLAVELNDLKYLKRWMVYIEDYEVPGITAEAAEKWMGIYNYETGNIEEAYKYFDKAFSISGGRVFDNKKDKKYIEFYTGSIKKTVSNKQAKEL